MEKMFAKGSVEWQMFTDFWSLCRKFWIPEDNDQYWEDLINSTEEFNRKYNTVYSKHLSLALLNSLDELSKTKNERR